ncbi:MAG: GCN5-related N-acetyltransferase [Candidatus Beckwithbacteria bacterium GW2011_GWB1_47_15]|uniref:GCN5-related N-acetyltransferase n=1 Tax=Candidatus Beckwithbacteria bacterium GW2011_GWB1_47_15 TaxID=1618371 RepID=A0A0G1RXH2_9BACT|nr:MAG: acyl-CoA N-acyltransferase [Candidatus Beckwithbacteria bacterium GW2011_GWC1_49_16]AQS30660.1 hypothetical protein [uncultured bacterium]KKU35848.1 MAG: GCN5-related N-acetyltransferase [Candidatus Beckwithbacteria bacterium GW2011_GWA1_46_30]KKU61812.1 MAG: GCN5-related N-acetyltransferase [Candidatus Beckwithbacteria bacterium GW2011_GWB1_47_15]KKU72634.1 MAG: GCN5-related N-acetyltransferase [Candidatus Beckwithbacteria bacterium GW2011_GWA2_47_25]KKW04198.1 MAG: GCN5-related N-ace
MSPPVKIRKAKLKDWKKIQKLNHEIFTANSRFDPFFNPDWEFTRAGTKYLKEITSDKKFCCLIAEIDGKPAGYLNGKKKAFFYRTRSVAELENIGVLPQYRSQKVGARLIAAFKSWCRQNNLRTLQVNCYYKNTRAIKFYRRLNLKPLDITFEGKI